MEVKAANNKYFIHGAWEIDFNGERNENFIELKKMVSFGHLTSFVSEQTNKHVQMLRKAIHILHRKLVCHSWSECEHSTII